MVKLEELFDLGFSFVRREVRVKVSLIQELEGNMHGGTGTSKCGTGTKCPLPLFSLWVPVPVSVVPVPICYCL